ncbi:MAG: hypothetical protein U0L85_09160 [Bacilli bacterium]|nr:hypothetical protein [Bacilli bacterium]
MSKIIFKETNIEGVLKVVSEGEGQVYGKVHHEGKKKTINNQNIRKDIRKY